MHPPDPITYSNLSSCLLIPRTEVILNFFSRARRDKIPKRVLYRGLISVQRAHKYITDGNEFLSLFTVLSISFIKQARVSLHNLLAPLRPVSFSISHLSLSITTVVPRVYNRRPVPSSLPPLSLLTLHSPGCPHRRAFFLSVLNWRKFFRDSSTAWFFYDFISRRCVCVHFFWKFN